MEGRAGIETLVRAGFDLTIGELASDELQVRDSASGQRYRTIQQAISGFSFVLGADIAHVADSEFLPESRGVLPESTRERVRIGVHWQNKKGASAFYGLTHLSEEFQGQPEGQLIGSFQINWKF